MSGSPVRAKLLCVRTMIQSLQTEVLDGTMHALDAGNGAPVVLLHGNPTSSELWRGVIPHLADWYRCIAPDLIGMGGSSKPAIDYTFADHAHYLRAWLNALDLGPAVFAAHDWGVALALDVAARHPLAVRGIAFMEGRVRPLPDWSAFDDGGRELFQSFRREPEGTQLVIEQNMMIETILQAGTVRPLTDEEMNAYRAPYCQPEDRRPLLQWTRQIPVGGEPADTAVRMEANYAAFQSSPMPKLALVASPGAVIDRTEIEQWERDLPALTVEQIGEGTHFVPHDQPEAIGKAMRDWMRENGTFI